MRTFCEVKNAPRLAALPAAPDDARARLMLLRRLKVGAEVLGVGSVVAVGLREAVHLCRGGGARPADESTALDVALAAELLRVLPRPGGAARPIW